MRTIHRLVILLVLALTARSAAAVAFDLRISTKDRLTGKSFLYEKDTLSMVLRQLCCQLSHTHLKGSDSSDAKKFVKRVPPSAWKAELQKIDPHDENIWSV